MEQYNNANASIGSIIGTYNYNDNNVSWEYIAIGDIENKMVKLLNFHNGKVVKLNREFLYVQGVPTNGRYLNYEQESMMTGDLVRFKKSKIPFRITKIHAKDQTCDMESDNLDFPVLNAPLAYLKYVNKEDKEKALEGIEK